LTILANSNWFSGSPTQLLAAPSGAIGIITVTIFDEAGSELGHTAATVTQFSALAPSAVPLPGSIWLMLAGTGLAGFAAKRQNQYR
jgi:hypothetical protein